MSLKQSNAQVMEKNGTPMSKNERKKTTGCREYKPIIEFGGI